MTRKMTREEWEAMQSACERGKDGQQGARWCVINGITGYCSYEGCPKVTGRPA